MQKTATLVMGAALVLATLAGAAYAKGNGGMRGMGPGPSFDMLDQNGDGEITRAELETLAAARFAAADANGDGLLSAEELSASVQERMQNRVSRMIERLDANDDGAISLEEMEAGREAHAGRRGDRAERMFERLDSDGNGSISQAEFDARPKHRGRN